MSPYGTKKKNKSGSPKKSPASPPPPPQFLCVKRVAATGLLSHHLLSSAHSVYSLCRLQGLFNQPKKKSSSFSIEKRGTGALVVIVFWLCAKLCDPIRFDPVKRSFARERESLNEEAIGGGGSL